MLSGFKTILWPFLIVLGGVALFVYLVESNPVQAPVEIKEKVWPVESMPIVFERLSPVHRLYGEVESFAWVEAAAPMAGVIEKVWVKEGDRIQAGQPLVSMSQDDVMIAVQQAQADVEDVLAQLAIQKLANEANRKRLAHETRVLALKQANVARTEQLIKRELASQLDLDQVKEALLRQEYVVVGARLAVEEGGAKNKQLQARLLKARANLSQAQLNKERAHVVAPYDLRVATLPVSEGSRVNVGTVLVRFYALDSLELRARLPVMIVSDVQAALKHQVTLKAIYQKDGTSVELLLARLAGESETSGLDAFFSLPDDLDQVRPGDLMAIDLQGEPLEKVVAVPYRALYGHDQVYLIRDGRLFKYPVTVKGEVLREGTLWALIALDMDEAQIEKENIRISVTHLPNAVTGLKVSEMDEGEWVKHD